MTLIAFEGIDGAGKSTQIPRIAAFLQARGFKTAVTAEPTWGQFGRQIREAKTRLNPELERRLFVDDRREHLKLCICPALERGECVISDRYFYSSIAYQGTRLDAFDHEPTPQELFQLQDEIAAQNLAFAPHADILAYFRIDPDIAMERMRSSRETLDPFEAKQNLVRVAAAFDRIADKHSHCIILDASQPADCVYETLTAKLVAILPPL